MQWKKDIQKINTLMKKKKIYCLVGAGLSRMAEPAMPDWYRLLEELKKDFQNNETEINIKIDKKSSCLNHLNRY